MIILGIETATDICASAIIDNTDVLIERTISTPHSHSERLLSIIDECFQEARVPINAIDAVAISIGPGSFTGLRIGLSVAKGLAFANSKKLIAVSTLEALAENARRNKVASVGQIVLPMIDARRDEVYTAAYSIKDADLEEIIPPCSITLSESINLIKAEHSIIVIGDGAAKFKDYLKKVDLKQSSRYIIPPSALQLCSAVSVAMLGKRKLEKNEISNIDTLEPFYVKDFYTLVKTQHQKVKI